MTLLDEVREAYADCVLLEEACAAQPSKHYSQLFHEEFAARRNLSYRASQAVSPAEAKAIMEKACKSYNNFETDIFDLLPPDCKVTIAREGSVCLYLTNITDEAKMKKLRKKLRVDELDFVDTNGVCELRLWWD